jgi:hypothetical protein
VNRQKEARRSATSSAYPSSLAVHSFHVTEGRCKRCAVAKRPSAVCPPQRPGLKRHQSLQNAHWHQKEQKRKSRDCHSPIIAFGRTSAGAANDSGTRLTSPAAARLSPPPRYSSLRKNQRSRRKAKSQNGDDTQRAGGSPGRLNPYGSHLQRPSEQSWLRRFPSSASCVSYIPPHPSVRPLHKREALGEAAGPSEEEDAAQYPSALPLALIIVGVCL